MQTPFRQKRPNFRILYYRSSKCRPCTVPPRAHAPFCPLPFPPPLFITEIPSALGGLCPGPPTKGFAPGLHWRQSPKTRYRLALAMNLAFRFLFLSDCNTAHKCTSFPRFRSINVPFCSHCVVVDSPTLTVETAVPKCAGIKSATDAVVMEIV